MYFIYLYMLKHIVVIVQELTPHMVGILRLCPLTLLPEYQVITISILSSIVRFDDSGMVPGRSVEFVTIYRQLDNTRT